MSTFTNYLFEASKPKENDAIKTYHSHVNDSRDKITLHNGSYHNNTHVLKSHANQKKRVVAAFSGFSQQDLDDHLRDNHDLS
jgi:hypothetical protein